MIQFIPNKNNGFKWHTNNNGIYFKGFFYDAQNKKIEAKSAIDFLDTINTAQEFKNVCTPLNGMFTIVIIKDSHCYVTSDSTRVFPVFYKKIKDSFVLSDDINLLIPNEEIKYDLAAEREFKSFGCCLGNKTLIKDIYQIQSSEYIIFSEDRIIKKGYVFSSATAKYENKEYNYLKKTLLLNFKNSFERLINSLDGKTVVLPLSGGFDSRLIASFLKYYNYNNVICYTYGKKGNIDMEISKKVANRLNFKWHFVEYTDELIDGFLETSMFKSYCKSYFHHSSMLFLQEYFAVKYLKENNLIPDDAVFIPGHDGGALAGGYLVKLIPEKIRNNQIIAKDIFRRFFNQKNKVNKSHIDIITSILLKFNTNYPALKPYSVYEDFIFKEISTKVIFNSANVYDFFGYQYRLPFWDKELLNSFKVLEPKLKINKKIYVEIITDFFKNFDLNFETEMQPLLLNVKIQNIKNSLKQFFPYAIVKKKLLKNDWLNAEKMVRDLEESLKQNNLEYNDKIRFHNDINKEWYLYYCKNQIE